MPEAPAPIAHPAPPHSPVVILSLTFVSLVCLLLTVEGFLLLPTRPLPGLLLSVPALLFCLLINLAVFARRLLLLRVLSSIWLTLSFLAIVLSPALAILLVSLLTSSQGQFTFYSPATSFFSAAAVLIFVGLSLLAGLAFLQFAAAHLPPRHLCPRCGYDLRSTPDEGGPLLVRCPECGYLR